MRLDHLIATVPDLRATHRRLIEAGFQEAWPPGPFWPAATTSGIALGGANLELIQPDEGIAEPCIDTLVLAPSSLEKGRSFLSQLAFEEREKIERRSDFLSLRGFPPDLAAVPQSICTNLIPADPPYPFFLCLYAPFLLDRLAPARFAAPHGPIKGLRLAAPEPETVRRLFAGKIGPIELDVESGPSQVRQVAFADGTLLDCGCLTPI